MTNLRKVITASVAATMLMSAVSVSTPASAFGRYGWGGGGFHRGWGGGWGRGGWGWGGGWGRGGWGWGGGGAAAGLLGGLALGTIAGAAASPYYGGYPYGGYGYYGSGYGVASYPYGYGGACSCGGW